MIMVPRKALNLTNVSESEKELTLDFLLKESIEILAEEADYFFSAKEQLVDFFIKGINLKNLKLVELQKNYTEILWSQNEIDSVVSKIERRIQKEINRTLFSNEFKFSNSKTIELTVSNEGFSSINEQLKTFKLSSSMAKLIDIAWKKTSVEILPKSTKKFSSKLKAGNFFLSCLGVSPKEVEHNAKDKVRRVIIGNLKQNKFELIYILKKEIIENLILISEKSREIEQPKIQNTQVQIA